MANIKLNNNEYPIPDSKLASIKADFIAHLGTIAGNGLKVVVGGVEYSVDATKVSGAIEAFEGVLDSLKPEVLALAPGLYQPGAIALNEEGDYEAASAMLKTSWDDLEANGVIAISKGVELPDDLVMNEYGFYFGVPYAMTIDGMTMKFTLNEDGSAIFSTPEGVEEIPAGTIVYGDHSIDMSAIGMPVFSVSTDGTAMEAEGFVFNLEILDLPEMNEYGFYFGIPYSMTMEGVTIGFTFNEDGSAIFNTPDGPMEIPAGAIVYGDHSIDMSALDMPVLGVSPDGTQIEADGIILTVGSSSVPPKGTVYLPNRALIEGDLVLPNDGRAISLPAGAFAGQVSLTGIVIPDSVTSIGVSVFELCSNLTSVAIGDGVTSIDDYAFYKCSNLTSITIPDSVTTIGEHAFQMCGSLTSITIPDSVTSIGDYAFEGCSNITTATMHTLAISNIPKDSLTTVVITSGDSISDDAFEYCTNLSNVIISDGVTSIGKDAFRGCSSLTSIIIPDSVTSIGDYAFDRCSGLTSVVIPDSVTTIGNGAFQNCNSLTGIIVDENNQHYKSIEGNLYSKDGKTLIQYITSKNATFFEIPNSVTSIGESAFYNCSNLSSIVIPNSVTSIGESAFYNCSNLSVYITDLASWCSIEFGDAWSNPLVFAESLYLNNERATEIVIPDGVTSIGNYAFYKCNSLASVEIPASVNTIGEHAFYYCDNLQVVYNNSNLLLEIGSKDNGYIAYYAKILVNNGETTWVDDGYNYLITDDGFLFREKDSEYYLISYIKNKETVTLPTDINGNPYHIRAPKGIKNMIIPEGITSIDDYAFKYCDNLTSVVIPDSVTSIGYEAFRDCSSLISVVIPASVTNIRYGAFYNCSSLASVVIPDSVTSIGDYVFYNCKSLASVVIGDSVTSIGISVFELCRSLISVVIGGSVTSIGNYAFRNCTGLSSVEIPDSVTSIGKDAFYNTACYNNESNWIDDVLYIGNYLIKAKTTISGKRTTREGTIIIAQSAFADCSSLTNITLLDGITSISDYAFSGCKALTGIVIPNSVTSIGGNAFYNCDSLTSVVIPDSVTSIGGNVFYGCSSLTSIEIPDSVTSIGSWAFSGCKALTSITIPDSVTTIGEHAFQMCGSLTSINIPDSVTSIAQGAFQNCSSLTSIVIPDSVTSIGNGTFNGCSSLTIYCEAESQPSGWGSSWNYSSRPVVWGYTGE